MSSIQIVLNLSGLAIFILTLVINGVISQGACGAFIPCQNDLDCWNGPGFRCAEISPENPLNTNVTKVCVCGNGNKTMLTYNLDGSTDGLQRAFYCTHKGPRSRKALQCRIRRNYPCFPSAAVIAAQIKSEGLSVTDFNPALVALEKIRDSYCGESTCQEVSRYEKLLNGTIPPSEELHCLPYIKPLTPKYEEIKKKHIAETRAREIRLKQDGHGQFLIILSYATTTALILVSVILITYWIYRCYNLRKHSV